VNPEPARPSPTDRALRVLCVDDNSRNLALLRAVLSAYKVECETADDGMGAIEAASRGGFDVILMDIQMPVMNGVEATRAIRRLPTAQAKAPIIAVTANTLDEQLDEYRAAGMNDCIAKPVPMAELMAKILHWTMAANEGVEPAAKRA
jgi:CheY-like chemotaxis protein